MKNLIFALCVLPLFVCCKPKAPLSTAAVPTDVKDNYPHYTRIKKGMEKLFMDYLCGTNAEIWEEANKSYFDDDKEVKQSEENAKALYKQLLEEKDFVYKQNFTGDYVLDIDHDNPDSIYYLNFSRSYKAAIIRLDSVKRFLE